MIYYKNNNNSKTTCGLLLGKIPFFDKDIALKQIRTRKPDASLRSIDTAPEKITARLSPFYLVMKFTCDQNPQNACYVNLAKLHCSCYQG